jgi:hypothetical protein
MESLTFEREVPKVLKKKVPVLEGFVQSEKSWYFSHI